MTTDHRRHLDDQQHKRMSLLPEPDLGLRVTRAQFARMCDVSRTTVTRWVQAGLIPVGVDNRFCPRAAMDRLVRHIDPQRMRARILRPMADEVTDARRRLVEAEARAQELGARVQHLERAAAEIDGATEIMQRLLAERWETVSARPAGEVPQILDDLMDEALITWSDQEHGADAEAIAEAELAAGMDRLAAAAAPSDAGDAPPEKEGGCGDLERGAGQGDG